MNESIAPNEYIVPRKSRLPGSSTSIGITPAKTSSESHGVLKLRVQPPEDLGQLPVARHRVRDARGADHARVRGDEEDRRGEEPDVDLRARRARRRAGRGSRRGPSTGSFVERPPVGRQPEQRLVVAVAIFVTGSAESAIERQREVDREDGDRDERDRRAGCSRPGRAPPRRGSRRSRSRCRRSSRPGSRARSRPGRRDAPVDVRGQHVRAEDRARSRAARAAAASRSRRRARTMFSFAASWMPTMFSATSSDDHDRRRRRCPTGSSAAAPRRSRGSAARRTPRWRP